jgi:hypothetical protein
MTDKNRIRIALLYPGDRETRQQATAENNRFARIFQALADLGAAAEPAVYHDDFCEEVHRQLLHVDGVLVWVNPITNGRDRHILDDMLREVAAAGVFVSTHPDIILKMGTKEVLYQTRTLGWGGDTYLYSSMAEMRHKLPALLERGEIRVLKQYRGNGGSGVWKIGLSGEPTAVHTNMRVNVRHAKRGSIEEEMRLDEFFAQCAPYFAGSGKMVDQAYQERLDEGMIRCYLVHDKVVGFGHQAINALYPAPAGAPPEEAPQPGPRLYHPPTMPEFQALKAQLEQEWVPAMQQLLDIETERLPVLWDADFLLGPKEASGADSYVLCEINVSSVAPFPDSATPFVAEAALARAQAAKGSR